MGDRLGVKSPGGRGGANSEPEATPLCVVVRRDAGAAAGHDAAQPRVGPAVIGAALVAAARGVPWTRAAAQLGVPLETLRGWLRRFTRRAGLVRAWLLGLLDALVDDPRLPDGVADPVAGALSVLGELRRQMPARWPLVASLSPWQLAARLSRGDQRELTGDVAAGRAPPWLGRTRSRRDRADPGRSQHAPNAIDNPGDGHPPYQVRCRCR